MEKVFGSNPEFVENAPDPVKDTNIEKNDVAPVGEVQIDLVESSSSSVIPNNETAKNLLEYPTEIKNTEVKEQDTSAGQEEVAAVQTQPAQDEGTVSQTQAAEQKPSAGTATLPETKPVETVQTQPKAEQEQATTATMNLKLFFMDITANGSIIRHEVTRKMKKSSTPLMDAMNALIAGPNAVEQSVGCTTLVSSGTRLLGASVKSGTATINFSSEFEYNQYGVEGLRGQLQQIVYTATAFPTVDNVQFLIDGKKKQYLGEEGVWIGTPLDRNSF